MVHFLPSEISRRTQLPIKRIEKMQFVFRLAKLVFNLKSRRGAFGKLSLRFRTLPKQNKTVFFFALLKRRQETHTFALQITDGAKKRSVGKLPTTNYSLFINVCTKKA